MVHITSNNIEPDLIADDILCWGRGGGGVQKSKFKEFAKVDQ